YRTDGGNITMPLTSPYGPGSLWLEVDIALLDLAGFNFDINLLYLEKINDVDLIDTPYERNDDVRDENGVSRSFDVCLSVSYAVFKWLKISAVPGLLFNDEGTDFHFDIMLSSMNLFRQKLD
ncbi:MAG: hypothetical protein JW874_05450, partial [Spirochaetales bacterium]|nr:hypothetical protein [Spirochaetales bacterium]